MSAYAIPHVEIPELVLPGEAVFERIKDALKRGADGIMNRMAGFSDAQELVILDSVFGDGAINLNTAPTYLALTTAAVNENHTGSTITEAAYTGYARDPIQASEMGAAAAGAKSNSSAITFADATGGSPSVVIGWAVCTAVTAGQVIVFGTCTSTTISTTQTPATVAIGALSVTLD